MQETSIIVDTASSISQLGVTGLLGLSNIIWFLIAKMLWKEMKSSEQKYQDCLKSN